MAHFEPRHSRSPVSLTRIRRFVLKIVVGLILFLIC